MAAGDDSQEKFGKENQLLDGKLSDGTATLAEEEEKAKHLLKLKAKHESTIGELEDKLRKDNQQKQGVERSKRKIETELNDMKEQVTKNDEKVLQKETELEITEKLQAEAKMKQFEEQVVASDDFKEKFGKDGVERHEGAGW